jgi:hypothetical protein
MKTLYRITSKETGLIVLRRRKIAKAFRWWLRENGFDCKSTHCLKYEQNTIHDNVMLAERDLNSYTTYQQSGIAENQNKNVLLPVGNFGS